jgi:hypothetical protein
MDSNAPLSRKEKEELVLDLYYKHNKTFRQITKEAKISPRDMAPRMSKRNNTDASSISKEDETRRSCKTV